MLPSSVINGCVGGSTVLKTCKLDDGSTAYECELDDGLATNEKSKHECGKQMRGKEQEASMNMTSKRGETRGVTYPIHLCGDREGEVEGGEMEEELCFLCC